MAVRNREDLVLPFPIEHRHAASHPGADLGHIEALLSNAWPAPREHTSERNVPWSSSAPREQPQSRSRGKKRSLSQSREIDKEPSSTHEGTFCKLCECWVPGKQRDKTWQQHIHSPRHRKAITTSNYRKYVLPEKKAAAEELRLQTSASKTPSMGSAARAAAAVRSEHELRIQSLHADICKEMLHHSGANADYHRLMSRLSPDRLAVAMPYTATRLSSNVGPDGSLTFLSASPAAIACLAALLPETHATTLVLSVASGHALDLAASTTALCLLVSRLRGAPQLARLQISMLTAIEDGGGGLAQQPMAARHAALEMRVLRSLKETMADNASLRLLSLKANYPAALALDWADLQAAAAKAPVRLRLAFLMGLHCRSAEASPLVSLPEALLKGILDVAIPASPCRVFLS